MDVFVTGGSGHIGSAVVSELIRSGHSVTALARSEQSSAIATALGARVMAGDVNDADVVTRASREHDAVVHLAYDHDSIAKGDLTAAATADAAVVRAFGDALEGTGKTFIGVGMATTGNSERDRVLEANPRTFVARDALALSKRGIRSILIAIAPVTHSDRDRVGFVPTIIRVAKKHGVSAYVDEGLNTWPAVHTLDLAVLFRLALESAPTGAQLSGAAESGVAVRDIAEVIAKRLGVPATSLSVDDAAEHFAPFPFMTFDVTLPNSDTRELLGWEPARRGLLDDLENGSYFDSQD